MLSAAALPLFLERQGERRLDWLAAILPALLGIAVALSLLLLAAAPWLVRLLGPGLAETASAQAAANLRILAWCVPGLMLHALFSIPCRPPSVSSWLGSARCCSTCRRCSTWPCTARPASEQLALACLLGSLLMPLVLLPSLWIEGWRPWHWRLSGVELGELGGRIGPLLLSNAASQGLALVERLVASLLGEGAVTWVNLARKLMNLPLIALMSLNQVLLGMMSRRQGGERLALLRRGLETASLLTCRPGSGWSLPHPAWWPVAAAADRRLAVAGAAGLVRRATVRRLERLAGALRLRRRRYSPATALRAARQRAERAAGGPAVDFRTAGDSPRGPWRVLCTALLLMRRQACSAPLPWARLWLLSAPGHGAAGLLFRIDGIWLQLGLGTVAGAAWRCSAWRSGCGPGAPIDPWPGRSLALGPSNNHCELARQAGVAK